ncbi:MAG TPA: CAP domain-containing protein [Planctomycetota bacterium]|nr:CAP domain-containing protein [Planctomycetota bacterium]
MKLVPALILSGALMFPLTLRASDVYVPPDREPSPEETLILELMNRFRADPKAEALRIAPAGAATMTYSGKGVDWKMFVEEMNELKAAPPLVFNLELLDASRKHAYYMIQNELTHVEDPNKPAFYGAGFGERCKNSGYKGFAGGENAFRDPGNVKNSHKGFITDSGEGPGGMQPGRGHRMNMINAGYKEVGGSAVPHGKGFSVVHDFGSRKVRMAGGVIYMDKDGDNFYSIGEGIGGVTIKSSDGASTATWKSGAFELDLKSDGPVTLTAEYGGQAFSKTFEAGKENIKFDWIVPEKIALDRADQLLADVAKIKETKSSTYTNAILALWLNTRGLSLDAARAKKIEEIAGNAGVELEQHQKVVIEALKNFDPKEFGNILDTQRKRYRGTSADSWFREAETVANMKYSAKVLDAAPADNPKIAAANKKQLATQIEEVEKQLTYAQLKQELSDLLVALKIPDAPAKRRRS